MAAINAVIAGIWKRNQPATEAKMQVIASAADQVRSGEALPPDERAEARSAAHKLAGSAGMFGFMDVTDLARSIENMLEAQALDEPAFLSTVAELQAALQRAFAAVHEA